MRQECDHITRGAFVETSYYLPLPPEFYKIQGTSLSQLSNKC